MPLNSKTIVPVIVVVVILGVLILLASGACNAPTETPAAVPPASPTAAEAAAVTPTSANVQSTSTVVGTDTPPGAPAPAAPQVAALSNLNLRGGPGTSYPVVGKISEGDSITIIGRNEDSSWLQVKTADGTAWLTADPKLVKVEGQDLSALPVVEAPPLPYDLSNQMVNMVLNQIPLVLNNAQSFTCASHGGINKLIPLAEGNVIGPHAGDFVLKNDNVLFKYTGGALVLIKENPIARFDGGAETMSFVEAMQAFQQGDIIWTGQLGQSPGRGVTGCDPAAK